MAAAALALGTMRVRQSTLSSLCAFLVTRGHLDTNPVARLDRPPHRREAPRQIPGSATMDTLVKAAQQRQRPRDLAIFLILRYSGMRRESVATLRVRNLDRRWGLRNVPVKDGKTRDIPLPTEVDDIKPDTPIFWSTFGQRCQGLVKRPMEGKNVAALQNLRTPDRLSDAEAPRPSSRRRDGGLRAARRSRASARPARPHADRDNAALRADPPGGAQAGRGVL